MDKSILKLIKTALREDVKNGDITTKATISKSKKAVGKFLVKADGIIAGLEITKTVFKTVDPKICLLYTSDAADERSSVDLGGRRIIKKKTTQTTRH